MTPETFNSRQNGWKRPHRLHNVWENGFAEMWYNLWPRIRAADDISACPALILPTRQEKNQTDAVIWQKGNHISDDIFDLHLAKLTLSAWVAVICAARVSQQCWLVVLTVCCWKNTWAHCKSLFTAEPPFLCLSGSACKKHGCKKNDARLL